MSEENGASGRFEQGVVSRTVWPWPDRGRAAAVVPTRSTAGRAMIQVAVMLAIAATLYFWFKHRGMAFVVLGLATVVLLCGLFVPPAFHAIERFGKFLGKVVGIALTWILLVPFFFVCFVPGHFFLWLRRRDPMHRAFCPDQASYWSPYHRHTARDFYRKQY